jgi:hypothetical protein
MSTSRITCLTALVVSALVATSARGDDLAAGVAARLRDSGALQGYRVNVKAKSGTVWLEGRVADEKQLAAALGIVESSPGVERVVNRLTIDSGSPRAVQASRPATTPPADSKAAPAKPSGLFALFLPTADEPSPGDVQLAQAVDPTNRGGGRPVATRGGRPPQALAAQQGRPLQTRSTGPRVAMRTGGIGEHMTLPAPGGYDGPAEGIGLPGGHVGDGQIVPGTMRYGEGAPVDGGAGYAGPGVDGGYAGGGPVPMGGTGVGMPPVPMRGGGPNMPNYAWPSYAAYPNYAALQYPTQYSPTAWPYIGPFYPYPQVPLGWRRVSLEWDDGWWWLDFDERHIHSHHR